MAETPVVVATGWGPWTIECSTCGPLGVQDVVEGEDMPFDHACRTHLTEQHALDIIDRTDGMTETDVE